MQRRTAESPMDFEWQTRAPGDVTSPFYQLGLQHDKQKQRSSHRSLPLPPKHIVQTTTDTIYAYSL